ncbi:DMT family transporter [Pseudomonas sp. CFBP 13710]|nr:DMT family transporter [Pseudomonas sp. CFBP 13710]
MESLMLNRTLLVGSLPLAISVMAGVLIPVQAASGGMLARLLGNPLWGAAVALLIGFIVLASTAVTIRLPAPDFVAAFQGPWWIWIGGITGAVYVATSLFLLPKVGAASFILCVIAGQMVAALLLDHFGLLGLAVKPVGFGRISGIAIMLIGLAIAQYSSVQTKPMTQTDAQNTEHTSN